MIGAGVVYRHKSLHRWVLFPHFHDMGHMSGFNIIALYGVDAAQKAPAGVLSPFSDTLYKVNMSFR